MMLALENGCVVASRTSKLDRMKDLKMEYIYSADSGEQLCYNMGRYGKLEAPMEKSDCGVIYSHTWWRGRSLENVPVGVRASLSG